MRSEQLGFLKNSFSTPSLCSGTWSVVQSFGLGFDSHKKGFSLWSPAPSASSVVQSFGLGFDSHKKGFSLWSSVSSVVEDFGLGFAFTQRKALLCDPLW